LNPRPEVAQVVLNREGDRNSQCRKRREQRSALYAEDDQEGDDAGEGERVRDPASECPRIAMLDACPFGGPPHHSLEDLSQFAIMILCVTIC